MEESSCVVVKLTSVPGTGNDTTSLYINPTIGGMEPAPNATATQQSTDTGIYGDWANLDLVCIRQGTVGNTVTGGVDSIRVGTTWADVVAAAVPVTTSGFSVE